MSITNPDLYLLAIFVFIIYVIVLFLFKKMHIQLPLHPLCLGLFISYIIVLLAITLLPAAWPIEIYRFMYPDSTLSDYYNLIPFSNLLDDPSLFIYNLREMIENVLLLIPFSFLYNFTFNQKTFKQILFRGFLLSISIEAIQLLISLLIIQAPYRYFDVNDLLMNSLGVAIGEGLWYLANRLIKKHYDKK